jgi:hypothetical protein
MFSLTDVQREQLRHVGISLLEIGHQSLVGEIKRVRVLPVVMHDAPQPLHDMVIVDFDGQFTAAVEAAWGEINRPHDRPLPVSEEHLGVELEMFQLVDLDAHVLHDSQTADTLDKLPLLKRVRRPGHNVNLDAATGGTH